MSQLSIHFKDGPNGVDLVFYKSVIPKAIVDKNGIFVETNAAFSGFFGYLPHEVNGRPFANFTHPEDLDADKAAVASLLARTHGATHYEMDKRYLTKRGESVWLRLVVDAIWIKGNDGSDTFSHFYVVALPYSSEAPSGSRIGSGSSGSDQGFDVVKWAKENRVTAAMVIAFICISHPDLARLILETIKAIF